MNQPPTESPPRAFGSWTRALQLWFVSLEVAGIYGVAAVLFVMSVAVWVVVALVAFFMRSPGPALPEAAVVVLGAIFGKPAAAIAWLVVMIVASIFITRGAFRREGWAHWGAIALVIVSALPVIQIAAFLREPVIWLIALAYCVVSAAFIVAMIYVVVLVGPWGAPPRGTGR